MPAAAPPEPSGSASATLLCSILARVLHGVHQGLAFLQEFLECVVCSPPLSHSAITFPFRILPC